MKIQILGYSGSGKSTFAKKLGIFYNAPILHIDTIKFMPDWKEYDHAKVEKDILAFLAHNDEWIIDGSYFRDAPQRFDECDLLFFFDFNRFKCLYGAIKRYLKYHNKTRDSIAAGCKEKIDFSFIKWILHDGRTKKRKAITNEMKIKYANKMIIFKNRRQVNKYLKKMSLSK